MLDGGENLREDDLAVDIRQFPLGGDFGVEFSAACVLHHQMQAGQCLHHFIQADDVGVVQLLHAGDLPGQEFLGLLVQLGLVQDLDGHLVCGAPRNRAQGKRAFSRRPFQDNL